MVLVTTLNGPTSESEGPSHLMLLFCATAGKNGEDLGSDEEQIVNIVTMLFDVYNNKVLSLQSQYVKPAQNPNDESEAVLTEECRQETGLDENAVRNGQPLDCVLEELDRILTSKGVHPDTGSKSFVFLTDGPCHVRQCLYPETSTKNMALASYFNIYYDLRKEFSRHHHGARVTDIKGMLDYLSLAEDESVEYGVRHCQNMAAIVSRLILDGHKFGERQIVQETLEGGICTKSEVVDDNTVVRARGLPWQSSDQDIARFFQGLNIAKGGVALCLSPQGRRNGEALIRFTSQEQRDLALKRHKHHIGQRYIEVYKASGRDFINVAGGSNSEAQEFLRKGDGYIIRMRGLPFTATSAQVMEFFTREPFSCEVVDGEKGILFVHYQDGRATGDAFVQFNCEEESQKALRKHRENMGNRYIELFKSTPAEVQQVLNRSMDPRNPEQPDSALSTAMYTQFPMQAVFSFPIQQSMVFSGMQKDCIRVRNLPPGTQVSDILSFLGSSSQNIQLQGVHMVFTPQGDPSGEAFIQMDSVPAAHFAAMQCNGHSMGHGHKKRFIDVLQVSGDEMTVILNSATFAPVPHGMPPMISAVPQGVSTLPVLPALPPMPSLPPQVQASLPMHRPMIAPGTMITAGAAAPPLQLTPHQLSSQTAGAGAPPPSAPPPPHPSMLGAMQLTQLPQPLQATGFQPAAVATQHLTGPQRQTFVPHTHMMFW